MSAKLFRIRVNSTDMVPSEARLVRVNGASVLRVITQAVQQPPGPVTHSYAPVIYFAPLLVLFIVLPIITVGVVLFKRRRTQVRVDAINKFRIYKTITVDAQGNEVPSTSKEASRVVMCVQSPSRQ